MHKSFCTQNFVRPKMFLIPDFFLPTFLDFWSHNLFGTTIFKPKIFLAPYFFRLNIFSAQTLFYANSYWIKILNQIFFDATIFWTIHFLIQNYLLEPKFFGPTFFTFIFCGSKIVFSAENLVSSSLQYRVLLSV